MSAQGQNSEAEILELLNFSQGQQEGAEGILPGWVNTIIQGASFGTSDELLGGLRGMFSPNLTREEGIEAARRTQTEFREDNPRTAFALEILGGVGAAIATAGAAGAVGGAGRVGAAVVRGSNALRAGRPLTSALVLGAGGGALEGAGRAEGGLRERAVGAAIGGTVGAVAGPVITGVGLGIRSLATRFVSPTGRAAGERAAREAAERALIADGVPIETARLAAERAQQLGVPITLMEIGEENVRAAAGATSRIPGPGMRTLQGGITRRAGAQNTRVLERLQTALGVDARDVVKDQADRIAARSAAAQPAYDAAYEAAEAIGGIADDEVNRLFRTTPEFRELYDGARRLWRLDDVNIPALFNEAGEQVGNPDLRALDWMKQALDDRIRRGAGQVGAPGPNEARLLRNRLNGMLNLVDNQVDEYKVARAGFAGASDLVDALERGANEFIDMDARQLTRVAAEMTPDQRELARLGLFDAIRLKVQGRGDHLNALRSVFESEAMRDRIQALAPDAEDFTEFVQALDFEKLIIGTENTVLSNSLTAARQQADRSFVTETVAGALTSRDPVRNAVNVGVRQAARTLQGTSPSFADEMAAIMTAGIDDPADLARVLDLMQTGVTRTQSAVRQGATAAGGGQAAAESIRFLEEEQQSRNPLIQSLEANQPR
ncbi:MAG: hypothetical protein KAJ42_08840 [Gemmatimonadetes bacterium]|nr:hypothetical protein [Gemmatimonadota bacterium]